MDYSTVTSHWEKVDGTHVSLILDIIKLTNPVYDGAYFCEKLLEITDRFGIICAIIFITRDNTNPNNFILDGFEVVMQDRFDDLDEREQLQFYCKFNRIDSDIRYYVYIYNIAIQNALKVIHAVPETECHYYQYIHNAAQGAPLGQKSAFYKTRNLAIFFKLRR